jgi:hypothetical protein
MGKSLAGGRVVSVFKGISKSCAANGSLSQAVAFAPENSAEMASIELPDNGRSQGLLRVESSPNHRQLSAYSVEKLAATNRSKNLRAVDASNYVGREGIALRDDSRSHPSLLSLRHDSLLFVRCISLRPEIHRYSDFEFFNTIGQRRSVAVESPFCTLKASMKATHTRWIESGTAEV